MIWFTSDLHLGHANIAGPKISKWPSGYRNFDSIEEMNKTIIDNINKYVQPTDKLYILGDFAMGEQKHLHQGAARIVCEDVHLIHGNHDNPKVITPWLFTSHQDVLLLKEGKQHYFLSHYAHRVWYGSHKGFIHLYGHSHGTIPDYGKSMDVGIDVAYKMFGEYRPFSITEIDEIMSHRKVEFPDGHTERTNVR